VGGESQTSGSIRSLDCEVDKELLAFEFSILSNREGEILKAVSVSRGILFVDRSSSEMEILLFDNNVYIISSSSIVKDKGSGNSISL